MNNKKKPAKEKRGLSSIISLNAGEYFDYNLLAVVVILICFGLIMLYSASSYEATTAFGDDMYYLRRQIIFSGASVGMAIIVSKIDYHLFLKFAVPLFFVSLLLMAMVKFTPLGVTVNGARRWLKIGVQFQPSEIAKIAVILIIVYMMKRLGRDYKTLKGTLFLLGLGALAGLGAYVFTENLSTAIIIVGIAIGIVFIAHPKTKIFIVLGILGAIAAAVFVIVLIKYTETSDSFRLTRVLTWVDPEKYADYGGWQVLQGLYAIGSGGIFGKGLGNSTQKLDIIPEAQNDMIFSIVCEEFGLFGAVLVLLLFGYLIYRLVVIAQNAPDKQGAMIASGIFVHISLQVVLNVCVVLNVIPTTGITLPFISYGGTSVIFLMFEIGIALGISNKIEAKDEETQIIDAAQHKIKKGVTPSRRPL